MSNESANEPLSSKDFLTNALNERTGGADNATSALRSEAFKSMAKNGAADRSMMPSNPSLRDTLIKFSADDRGYLAMNSSASSESFIRSIDAAQQAQAQTTRQLSQSGYERVSNPSQQSGQTTQPHETVQLASRSNEWIPQQTRHVRHLDSTSDLDRALRDQFKKDDKNADSDSSDKMKLLANIKVPPKMTDLKERAVETNKFRDALVARLNRYRKSIGQPAFEIDPRLNLAATVSSDYQKRIGNVSHKTNIPGWREPDQRVSKVGLGLAGENAAWGQTNVEQLFQAWYHSDGHRALLDRQGSLLLGIGRSGTATTMVCAYKPKNRG